MVAKPSQVTIDLGTPYIMPSRGGGSEPILFPSCNLIPNLRSSQAYVHRAHSYEHSHARLNDSSLHRNGTDQRPYSQALSSPTLFFVDADRDPIPAEDPISNTRHPPRTHARAKTEDRRRDPIAKRRPTSAKPKDPRSCEDPISKLDTENPPKTRVQDHPAKMPSKHPLSSDNLTVDPTLNSPKVARTMKLRVVQKSDTSAAPGSKPKKFVIRRRRPSHTPQDIAIANTRLVEGGESVAAPVRDHYRHEPTEAKIAEAVTEKWKNAEAPKAESTEDKTTCVEPSSIEKIPQVNAAKTAKAVTKQTTSEGVPEAEWKTVSSAEFDPTTHQIVVKYHKVNVSRVQARRDEYEVIDYPGYGEFWSVREPNNSIAGSSTLSTPELVASGTKGMKGVDDKRMGLGSVEEDVMEEKEREDVIGLSTGVTSAQRYSVHENSVQKGPVCEHAVQKGPANYGLVREDGVHHNAVHHGLVSKAVVRPGPAQGPVYHGLLRKDAVPKDYNPKQRIPRDTGHQELIRKDAVYPGLVRKDQVPKDYNPKDPMGKGKAREDAIYPGLVRKDQVPKDYNPKDKERIQRDQAREQLLREYEAGKDFIRQDFVSRNAGYPGLVRKDQVHHGLVRKDQVPKDYNPKDKQHIQKDREAAREQLLREHQAREDAIRRDAARKDLIHHHAAQAGRAYQYPAQYHQDAVHDHPAAGQNAHYEQTAHAAPAHAGPSHAGPSHAGPSHAGLSHAGPSQAQSNREAPRPSSSNHHTTNTHQGGNHAHNHGHHTQTPQYTNEAINNAQISAFDLIDSYGSQLDPMSFTDREWDEIMWYQVRYVRGQKREKRRGYLVGDLRDVFAGAVGGSGAASERM